MRIPLFPLNTVLFPEGILELRIFEQRYLHLVSECLRQESPFGICLIQAGKEVGAVATPHPVGTLARIIDWEKRTDGLLGIRVQGGQRFRIIDSAADSQQLLYADVHLLDEPSQPSLNEELQPLAQLLQRILGQLGSDNLPAPPQLDNPSWISCRLAELLPLPRHQKQRLLEIDDPNVRLRLLQRLLQPKTSDS